MICPICERRRFKGDAESVVVGKPRPIQGDEPLGSVRVKTLIYLVCNACGHKLKGVETTTVICKFVSADTPYPKHLYDFVQGCYGDAWDERVAGNRLSKEAWANPSSREGWVDAQNYSSMRGGKIPPKGWGHATSSEYLNTEVACHHLKILSLKELLI